MLDTRSPEDTKFYLHRQHEADVAELTQQQIDFVSALRQRVWNALIPAHAVKAELKPWGVRWLHPTKGWRTVGKKRFAVRGVI